MATRLDGHPPLFNVLEALIPAEGFGSLVLPSFESYRYDLVAIVRDFAWRFFGCEPTPYNGWFRFRNPDWTVQDIFPARVSVMLAVILLAALLFRWAKEVGGWSAGSSRLFSLASIPSSRSRAAGDDRCGVSSWDRGHSMPHGVAAGPGELALDGGNGASCGLDSGGESVRGNLGRGGSVGFCHPHPAPAGGIPAVVPLAMRACLLAGGERAVSPYSGQPTVRGRRSGRRPFSRGGLGGKTATWGGSSLFFFPRLEAREGIPGSSLFGTLGLITLNKRGHPMGGDFPPLWVFHGGRKTRWPESLFGGALGGGTGQAFWGNMWPHPPNFGRSGSETLGENFPRAL